MLRGDHDGVLRIALDLGSKWQVKPRMTKEKLEGVGGGDQEVWFKDRKFSKLSGVARWSANNWVRNGPTG